MIDTAQQKQWDDDGFFIVPGFVGPEVCDAMIERVVEISREANGKVAYESYLVMPEQNLAGAANAEARAEQLVSKIFRLHRDGLFREFIESSRMLEIGRSLLGPQIDCFLSQFIFKNPAAWGQPWHQDSFYFPFDRTPQVGFWLAVTEATLENGCLRVLPGSHREPIHEHVPDRRPNANIGYVEIVDCDFSEERPVTMASGDLLVFHSHLMHRSKDNRSDGLRAAMVYHMAERGTQERHEAVVNDWMCLPDADAASHTRKTRDPNEQA